VNEGCLWCGRSLRYQAGKGWVHVDTGEIHGATCHCVMTVGPAHQDEESCPRWIQDHLATPDRSERLPL